MKAEQREVAIKTIVKATQWLFENPLNRKETRAPGGEHVVFATTRSLQTGIEGVYFGTSETSGSIVLQDQGNPSSRDYVPQTYRESNARFRYRNETYPPLANGEDIDLGVLRKFSDETLERMAENVRRVLKDNS